MVSLKPAPHMEIAQAEFQLIVQTVQGYVHQNSLVGQIMTLDITGNEFSFTFRYKGTKAERLAFVEEMVEFIEKVWPDGKKEDGVIKFENSTVFEVIRNGAGRMRVIGGWEPNAANASLKMGFGTSGLRLYGTEFENLMNGGLGKGGEICPKGLPYPNRIGCVMKLKEGNLDFEEVKLRLMGLLLDESWGTDKEERKGLENDIGMYEYEGELHLDLPYIVLEELTEALEEETDLFVFGAQRIVSAVYRMHSSQVSEVTRLVTSIIATASVNKMSK